MNKSQSALHTSLERLSSGLRINSAKDDAAGLAISNRFTTQIRGIGVATRNANDGISFAQTTESALDETTTALQRIRDLAVQSSNDTNSASDRQSLQKEVSQLVSEIDRIAKTTTFNGSHVADGSLKNLSFQIGANAGEQVSVSGVDARASALGSQPGAVQSTYYGSSLSASATDSTSVGSFSIQVAGNTVVNVTSTANGGAIGAAGTAALTTTTDADYGSGVAKDLAARINDLREKGTAGLENVYATAKTVYNYEDTASSANASSAFVGAGTLANGDLQINGVDIGPVTVQEKDADGSLVNAINAKSDVTGVQASIDTEGRLTLTADDGRDIELTAGGTATTDILFDGGSATAAFTLTNDYKAGDVTISTQDTLTADADFTFKEDNVQAVGTIANADVTTKDAAGITIKAVDSALSQVDSFRATLGATQNRFESTIRNLGAVSESLSAANSRIKDADFATETANLSKNQVLQQAGISILAQANALPQQALSLLG